MICGDWVGIPDWHKALAGGTELTGLTLALCGTCVTASAASCHCISGTGLEVIGSESCTSDQMVPYGAPRHRDHERDLSSACPLTSQPSGRATDHKHEIVHEVTDLVL